MPSRLQQTILQYRQALAQRDAKAERALVYAHAQTLKRLQPALDKLYRQIAEKQKKGETVPPSWLYEERRLETIKRLITNEINHYAAVSHMTVNAVIKDSAQLGQQSALRQLNASLPASVDFSFGVPSHRAITDITGATQAGSPLADLFGGFGHEAADRAASTLISAIALGENPRAIASALAAALNISRNRALTIARTEMLRAYRSANLATYRANSDVVAQWRWSCDFSSRTCIVCLMLDGTLHDLDEEMGSHPNCRCSPVPVTKSWDVLLGDLGLDLSDLEEPTPQMTGADWFADQDASVQRQILGGAKYTAWKKGDLQLKNLVGRSHDPDWGPSVYEKSLAHAKKG